MARKVAASTPASGAVGRPVSDWNLPGGAGRGGLVVGDRESLLLHECALLTPMM
jgi:hypothetical protein